MLLVQRALLVGNHCLEELFYPVTNKAILYVPWRRIQIEICLLWPHLCAFLPDHLLSWYLHTHTHSISVIIRWWRRDDRVACCNSYSQWPPKFRYNSEPPYVMTKWHHKWCHEYWKEKLISEQSFSCTTNSQSMFSSRFTYSISPMSPQ